MILHLLSLSDFNKYSIILGSVSPRRLSILSNAFPNLKVIQISPEFEETLIKNVNEPPESYVTATALGKMNSIISGLHRNPMLIGVSPIIVITADTIVVHNGVIFEKPSNEDDAISFMKSFSNNTVDVITSFVIADAISGKILSTSTELTKVFFCDLSESEIRAYVQFKDWVDKAGGFGYQGLASSLISKIEGCYYNVMGLPISKISQEILRLVNEHQLTALKNDII